MARGSRISMAKPNLINSEIRAREVRLVGENITPDIYPLSEALKMGDDMNLDLVLINPNSEPPICKLMDYDKYLFNLKKNKVVTKSPPIKEIKFGPNISENDFETKVNQIIKFLSKGHKVKTFVQFRGREMAHQDLGKRILLELAQAVIDYGTPEALPDKCIGKKMYMNLKPK